MSSNEDNWVYVDDVDPRVVYSDGDWISSVHRGSSSGKPEAWNGTLHGSMSEGATATLTFTGSEIGVVASGFTNQDGWPAVDISIDGIRRILNTLPMGDVSTRSTRFTNPTILSSRFDPGDHVLTITSINGTASNPFWLDCIVIKPLSHSNNDLTASRPLPEGVSVSTGDVGSSKASSSSKRIELRSSYSLSFESSDFSRYTEATETGTPPAKNHTSVILGGILGGIVGAVLLALIGYYCFKHRKKYWYHADEIVPADVGSGKRISLFESSRPSVHHTTEACPQEQHLQYPAPSMIWPEKAAGGRGPCMPLPVTTDSGRTSPSPPLSRNKSFIETMRNRLLPPVSRHGATRARTMEREVDAGYLIPAMVDGMTSAGRLPPPYTAG